LSEIHSLIETANHAAFEAGKAIINVYWSGEFSTSIKKDESPLTVADKDSHKVINEILSKTNLPILSEEGADILYSERKNWEWFWLIDPLDGTKEFISKTGEFTVNIALVKKDKPIAGVIYVPLSDILYYGSGKTGVFKKEKGRLNEFPPLIERNRFDDLAQRDHLNVVASRSYLTAETKEYIDQFRNATVVSSGSSIKFMLLIENRADIYPRLGTTMEWDTAAAHAILNASGRGIYHTDLKTELTYNKEKLTNPFFIAF
jgi:3'(2'), 5'-bisphosphate nucleotidase